MFAECVFRGRWDGVGGSGSRRSGHFAEGFEEFRRALPGTAR